MGQRKGNPTPTAEQQAYMDKYGQSAVRTNNGTTPVMISHTTTLNAVIDATFGTDVDISTVQDVVATKLSTADAITTYAPKASPALTGTPTSTTAAVGTNTTQVATTAFVIAENIRLVYKADDATVAITAAVNNKVFIATKASATQTFTLPAASTAGLQYTFICGNAGGEIKILGSAGDTINCKAANAGASVSVAADTGIKNTAATNVLGDTITLVSDGATNWYGIAQSGIFATN
jgi:hypothetical protein